MRAFVSLGAFGLGLRFRSLIRGSIACSAGLVAGAVWVASDVTPAAAVGTRTFDLDTQDKLSGGEQKGTAITASGEVEPGWVSNRTSIVKGTSVFCALPLADGSVLLGVGPEGRVLKIDASGHETIVAETGTMAVTSLVEGAGGKIYAATIPEGEIFIVDPAASVGVNPSATPPAKLQKWTKLPSDHVWALAYDKRRGALFAATGPEGHIYRIDASGTAQPFFTADDTQVVSLAVSPNGTLYAGTSSKGLLLAIDGAGKAEVVQDFAGHEVKGIVFAPAAPEPSSEKGTAKGAAKPATGDKLETLYCIVNEYATPPEPPRKVTPSLRIPSASTDAPRPLKAKGEVWKISELATGGRGGRPERLHRDDSTAFFSIAAEPSPRTDGAVVYVGTANEGRVLAIDEQHGVATVAKADSRQIGAIGVSTGKAGTWFATGDSASFHRVTGIGGADASWTSKPLDAGLKATFGKVSWRTSGAAGSIELQTRSGATATPDAAWSEWSAPLSQPGKATSPPARFVQLRARWRGASGPSQPSLRGVSLAFVTENLRAIVTEVTLPAKGSATSGIVSSGAEAPSHSSSTRISWHVDNPDGDTLRYRLWFRREDSTVWRPIVREDEPISATEHTWTTDGLAEGWYRVRVEASDEVANPIGEALKHAADSAPFIVDNTPPVITRLALVGGRLQADVVDGVGPIARLEVQLDGRGPWRPVAPIDGILDDAEEKVDAQLGITGSHVIALRAYDAAGNSVTREIDGK